MAEGGIILSFDEARILLHGMGVRQVEGVYMPEKEFSEREVIQALHHLTKRGLLTASDTGFYLREDVRKTLEIMGNPDEAFVWGRKEGDKKYFCYAAAGQVVVSERDWRKKEALRLQRFPADLFEIWKEKEMNDYCGN